MKTNTIKRFNEYTNKLAVLNNVEPSVISSGKKFAIAPAPHQKWVDRVKEQSVFLGAINIVLVEHLKNDKLGLSNHGLISSRTSTPVSKRTPTNVGSVDGFQYECTKTNFDYAIRYELMDQWAHLPDYQLRVRNFETRKKAQEIISIGWNGISVAANSDPVTNPLGQDINVGWLESMRQNAPQQIFDEGTTPGKVIIGAAGDFQTLDACVKSVADEHIESQYHTSQLCVITGSGMVSGRAVSLLNHALPSELGAANQLVSQHNIGGLPVVIVSNFPKNTILITDPKNLSLYIQNGSQRKHIRDNPDIDSVEFFSSENECYVVENFEECALIENIEIA